MICVKCGEENPYGTKVCTRCNARIINVPLDRDEGFNFKELSAGGDPFKTGAREFEYSFPYKHTNFLKLVDTVHKVLEGTLKQDSLDDILNKIEKGSNKYLYELLPGIKEKVKAPVVAAYRPVLEKSIRLTEEGHVKYLESIDEINLVFEDGQNYHLEKGLSIAYMANNLLTLGIALATKIQKREDTSEVEGKIEKYLATENLNLF